MDNSTKCIIFSYTSGEFFRHVVSIKSNTASLPVTSGLTFVHARNLEKIFYILSSETLNAGAVRFCHMSSFLITYADISQKRRPTFISAYYYS